MSFKKICIVLVLVICQNLSAEPQWIWKKGKVKTEKAQFKKTITLNSKPAKAALRATCDNQFTLEINGKEVTRSTSWDVPVKMDIAKFLKKGDNQILVKTFNEGSMGGYIFELKVNGKTFISDKGWEARDPKGEWHQAVVLKPHGAAPWGKVLDKKPGAKPVRTAPANMPITAPPGFKVEKLYDIPNKKQGSWVGLTYDHKNRLIACDQYGGIYRVTLGKPVKVEKLNVKTGNAHGVLYAFNSLYVFNYMGGLFRLTDTNGDDQYDKEEHLIKFSSKGEHGVHSIVLSPDKKSLYLVGGNNTDLPASTKNTRTSKNWKEDHLLPRMADGRGHNKGRLAPGGLVIKISPDAKKQELIAHGFRNQFDVAFDTYGEMFTFDADMEYDIGSPWYRPTRVNHIVSGADYGWRHGTGKWPGYYTDTLPTTLDIGPGSPTGVSSGIGAKFPAKYQKAIYINDWTYGTMYAVHLKPNGATYKATREEFITGKPLPLTDVIIHPDGNMYFMVGGRRTTSALYKVSYVGKESTAPVSKPVIPEAFKSRRELEKLHVDGTGEEAIAKAWPHLGSNDRYIRHAARVAIEKQSTSKWNSKFYAETNPWAIVEGACALARMGDKNEQSKILAQLNKLDYKNASRDQFLAAIRSYQLAFTRLGKPSEADAKAVIAKLNPLYLSKDNLINRELSQVLLYLNAPGAVSKTVQEMLIATEVQKKIMADSILERNDRYKVASQRMEQFRPNVQQFTLAFSLRSIKEGWTEADRAGYFSWFPRAKTWQGGNSFSIFIENSRKEALAHVSDPALKKKYNEISSKSLVKPRAVAPPKGPGRMWTVSSAVEAVQNNLTGRNFKSGENLFHATGCAACHRFSGQGMGIGPDLTGSANRYSLKDMMDNIIEPSKVISDQYGSTQFMMKDGSQIIGRAGTEEGGLIHVMTNPFSAESNVDLKLADIKSKKHYPVSPMPAGLVNSLNPDELSDLIAYIFSAGNPEHKYFAGASYKPQIDGAVELFNGKDLSGWKGNNKLWSVKDGVIYGTTKGGKIKANTFLVWEGEVQDFHLSYEAKAVGNNSGMMYRSQWMDESIFRLKGYQADLHPKQEYAAMLYAEQFDRRGIVATRGQTVVIDSSGKKKVTANNKNIEQVDVAKWQTYEIICKGNRLIHKLNGKVAVDITEDHPKKMIKGLIGMQLHAGPEMECWFRNIKLKKF